MSVQIPPLPKATDNGKCPWCKRLICDAEGEGGVEYGDPDILPDDLEKAEAMKDCPKCHHPIAVKISTRTVCHYEVEIKADRSATDKRYLELIGAKE